MDNKRDKRLVILRQMRSEVDYKLKKLSIEKELVLNETMKLLREKYWYPVDMYEMHRAWLWNVAKENGKLNGEKIDNRKKYPEKESFIFIEDWIGVKINRKISILKIWDCNGSQGYDFVFKVDGLDGVYSLLIPCIQAISTRAYEDYGEDIFKLTLKHKTDGHAWDIIGCTDKPDQLKEIFDGRFGDHEASQDAE